MSHDKATATRDNMRNCSGVEHDRHWYVCMGQCGVTFPRHSSPDRKGYDWRMATGCLGFSQALVASA